MSDKTYSINDVENGGYNYIKMELDENSHVGRFAIPLKDSQDKSIRVNGSVRMICVEGEYYIRLFDVTKSV